MRRCRRNRCKRIGSSYIDRGKKQYSPKARLTFLYLFLYGSVQLQTDWQAAMAMRSSTRRRSRQRDIIHVKHDGYGSSRKSPGTSSHVQYARRQASHEAPPCVSIIIAEKGPCSCLLQRPSLRFCPLATHLTNITFPFHIHPSHPADIMRGDTFFATALVAGCANAAVHKVR